MRAQRSREVERDACWVRRPMRSDLQVVLIDPAPSLRPSIWKNLCDLALELAAGLSVQRGRKNLNEMGGSVACAGSDEP
jgi:ABC-type microcin C transport system duplicated ATPase subunit YejF